jgi:hypothetical protein
LLLLASKDQANSFIWERTAKRMLPVFFVTVFIYAFMWAILAIQYCIFCIDAHEGISIPQTLDVLAVAMQNQFPFVVGLMLWYGLGLVSFLFFCNTLYESLTIFYGVSLILISTLLLYPWEGFDLRHSVSFALHNWHAILTFGSVVIVDSLYMMLKGHTRLLFTKLYPLMTLGIWLGLGLDFISAGLVFEEEFHVTQKFLFSQTLIGIVIINGVILAGPLSRAVLAPYEKLKDKTLDIKISPKLYRISGICASISLVTWFSNGALDGFRSLTLSYGQLWIVYVFLVLSAFVGHELFEKLLEARKK